MKRHVRKNYDIFKARWLSTLSREVIELFDHAAEFYEDAEAHLLRKPRTLLHGDLKFPNLFWDYGVKGGEPVSSIGNMPDPDKALRTSSFFLSRAAR